MKAARVDASGLLVEYNGGDMSDKTASGRKFDDMTPKQVAAATLEMMGYEQVSEQHPTWWDREDAEEGWHLEDTIHAPDSHAFAAEVKQWMMDERDEKGERKWAYEDIWVGDSGEVVFFAIEFGSKRSERIVYDNMDAHPRAVYEAALRAEAEKKQRSS